MNPNINLNSSGISTSLENLLIDGETSYNLRKRRIEEDNIGTRSIKKTKFN